MVREVPFVDQQINFLGTQLSQIEISINSLSNSVKSLSDKLFVWLVVGSAAGIATSTNIIITQNSVQYKEIALLSYNLFLQALQCSFLGGIISLFYAIIMQFLLYRKAQKFREMFYFDAIAASALKLKSEEMVKRYLGGRNHNFDILFSNSLLRSFITFVIMVAVYIPYIISICYFTQAIRIPVQMLLQQ